MKIYTNILLSLYSLVFLALTGLGIYLYPLSGDLTRIGGFTENNFRGQLPLQAITHSLSDFDQYDHYYDVIILGDSFSQNRQYGWQQHFAINTGLSITTLHVNSVSIEELLAHPVFIQHPPKLLIYETAERRLNSRLNKKQQSCGDNAHDLAIKKISIASITPEIVTVQAEEKNYLEVDYEQAVSFLKANYRNHVENRPRTISLELTTEQLFSHKKPDRLLVLKKDFSKRKWPTTTFNNSLCTLKNYQRLVQKNGKTWFVSMIAPDKLTAYTPYIKPNYSLPESFLENFQKQGGFQNIDLLTPLSQAIQHEQQDIYLPNDSHWSEAGHKIVAKSLLDFLINHNIIKN